MEAKTIGKFIATLRKANGMTQKELAERLNVSDKSISRWERDEGTPDLSMIPVLAEVFGVTCDELLRGERKSPAEREEVARVGGAEREALYSNETPDSMKSELTTRGEKQLKRLLKVTLSKYRTNTYIAIGVSIAGIIAALIGNLAFLRATLGFLMGSVFFVASIVCQAIFVNRAFLSVEDAEFDEGSLSGFKKNVISLAEMSIGVTIAFIGFTFPLMLVDAYMGLGTDSLLLFGSIGAAVLLLLYAVVLYFLNVSFVRKGVYTLTEQEAVVYYHNHGLKSRLAAVLGLLVLITFFIHHVMTSLWGPYSIIEGTTFHDYESFIAYMEQDIPYEPHYYNGNIGPNEEAVSMQVGETTYYDREGNVISEEEARHRTLEDINGTVVCEYTERNETVASMSYSPKEGTVLPITVRTYEEVEAAKAVVRVRHVLFGVAYVAEAMGVIGVYFLRRKK